MVDVTFSGWGNWNESEYGYITVPIGKNYKVQYMNFSLTEEDEREYENTKKLDHVKHLLPAPHIKNCEFERIKQIFLIGGNPDYPAYFIDDESIINSRPNIDTVSDPVFVIQNKEENILNISKSLELPTKESDLNDSNTPQKLPTGISVILKDKTEFTIDTNLPTCSDELAIALEAWHAVLSFDPPKPIKGSRKALIFEWLEEKYPKISTSSKMRIAVLLNPDSAGGAPSY